MIDFNTGESIGHSRAATRYVSSILSAIAIYIGVPGELASLMTRDRKPLQSSSGPTVAHGALSARI